MGRWPGATASFRRLACALVQNPSNPPQCRLPAGRSAIKLGQPHASGRSTGGAEARAAAHGAHAVRAQRFPGDHFVLSHDEKGIVILADPSRRSAQGSPVRPEPAPGSRHSIRDCVEAWKPPCDPWQPSGRFIDIAAKAHSAPGVVAPGHRATGGRATALRNSHAPTPSHHTECRSSSNAFTSDCISCCASSRTRCSSA